MLNDYAREPVPEGMGVSGWRIGLIYIGVGLALPAFLMGAGVGISLGLSKAVLATLVAGTILWATAALTGSVGVQTKLSTYMITRFTFGRYGVWPINIIMAITLFGWFGVTIAMFSQAIDTLFSEQFGIALGTTVWNLIGGALMISTAIWGFRGLDKLSLVAVPLITILLVVTDWNALQLMSFRQILSVPGDNSMSFGVTVSIIVGAWMVGATVLPDIARYGRSKKDAVFGAFLCFVPGLLLILTTSMIPALATGKSNIITVITGFGWPVISTLILLAAAWSSNDNNLYSASLSLSSLVPKIGKWKITLVAGVIGTLLAILGIMENFISFLILLGIFVPPVAGVFITDYFLRKDHYHFDNLDQIVNIRMLALLSWGVGSLIAFCTLPSDSHGFAFFQLSTIPALDALLTSALSYLVIYMAVETRAE